MEKLIKGRRLGRTNLAAKPGQVGVSDATKSSNLGVFDYAHLTVPLPADLKGSGIWGLRDGEGVHHSNESSGACSLMCKIEGPEVKPASSKSCKLIPVFCFLALGSLSFARGLAPSDNSDPLTSLSLSSSNASLNLQISQH